MINYIHGEIYRLLRKKSMYIYFGSFAALYFIFILILSGRGLTPANIAGDADVFFPLLSTVIGGYLFAAIYIDDLRAKNLATLIGFGMGKAKIVLSKFLLMSFVCTVIFGLVPLLIIGIYAIFGVFPTAAILGAVYAAALSSLLTSIAFSALSGILVYGLQRGTFAVVLYILLTCSIISQLLGLLLNSAIIRGIAPGLDQYLMLGITSRIKLGLMSGQSVIFIFVEYIIYVAVALTLSTFAFHKKELEF